MERDEQINFRLREEVSKKTFADTLREKQKHIPSQTALFQGVIAAVMKACDRGELIEWPVELKTKKNR